MSGLARAGDFTVGDTTWTDAELDAALDDPWLASVPPPTEDPMELF